MDKIPEHRKNAFKTKAVFKADELRRRREELQVEIRRKNREESLAKRRNLNVPASPDSDDEAAVATINAQVSYNIYSSPYEQYDICSILCTTIKFH
jgi:hypothetical protein